MDEQELGKNLWTLSYPKLKTLKYKRKLQNHLEYSTNWITSHIYINMYSHSLIKVKVVSDSNFCNLFW